MDNDNHSNSNGNNQNPNFKWDPLRFISKHPGVGFAFLIKASVFPMQSAISSHIKGVLVRMFAALATLGSNM